MFNRYLLKKPSADVTPITYSYHIDQYIDQILAQPTTPASIYALRLWTSEKNQLETRLNNLIDLIGLCRLSRNRTWVAHKMMIHYRIFKGQTAALQNYKDILFEELDDTHLDFMNKLDEHMTQLLARMYVFLITALDGFDKNQADITPELKTIYPQQKSMHAWKAEIAQADERYDAWKMRNASHLTQIACMDEVIDFFRVEMNEGPLRKVRFKC